MLLRPPHPPPRAQGTPLPSQRRRGEPCWRGHWPCPGPRVKGREGTQTKHAVQDGAGATAHTVGVGRGVGPPWGLPKAPPARQGQLAPDHASPPPAEEVSRGAGHSTPGVPDQLHLPWGQRKDARALLKLLIILWD